MPEAAPRLRVGAIEIPAELLRRSAQIQQKTTETTAPTDNAVYKIIFDEALTPEAKRAALAQYLTFPGTKEESRARVAAYRAFEEWLQSERERMSREIIRLTDTETFSELQSCYQDLNGALLQFDEKMKPLSDIIDAIYVLRTNNKTIDAFVEIQQDKKAEAVRKQQEAAKEVEFQQVQDRMKNLRVSIARLSEQRSFFGFGGVKEEARKQIAENSQALETCSSQLDQLQHDVAAIAESAANSSQLGEFVKQKDKLRELLDISSDVHKQRQKELVTAADAFIGKAKDRIGSVRTHLGKLTDQIDSLYDSNVKMSGVYAVMSDGLHDATSDDTQIRTDLQAAPEDEATIARLAREDKLSAVEDHVKALDTAAGSTIETLADLTSQTIRIRTMRDSNEAQIDKARRMHTQGVAGVADRLSVVLNAVSAAALGESSEMARSTLAGMVDRTNQVAQQEAIQVAMGVNEINRDVEKAIADLGAYGEVVRASTGIYREGLAEIQQNIAKMKDLTQDVKHDIREASGVHADAAGKAA